MLEAELDAQLVVGKTRRLSHRPVLPIVDMMMPLTDGYATMRPMRVLPGCDGIPIDAVTAKAGDGERQRCLEAGASAYVPKSVTNGPTLLHVLAGCLADSAGLPRHDQVGR